MNIKDRAAKAKEVYAKLKSEYSDLSQWQISGEDAIRWADIWRWIMSNVGKVDKKDLVKQAMDALKKGQPISYYRYLSQKADATLAYKVWLGSRGINISALGPTKYPSGQPDAAWWAQIPINMELLMDEIVKTINQSKIDDVDKNVKAVLEKYNAQLSAWFKS